MQPSKGDLNDRLKSYRKVNASDSSRDIRKFMVVSHKVMGLERDDMVGVK